MKRLFGLVQILAIIFPIIIFAAYIIMDEGDQFTSEHYLVTGLSAIPFFIVLALKFLMSGVDREQD
ncbi:MAG: hypothetical protein AABY47_04160 [Pseudomonadota bacterium]